MGDMKTPGGQFAEAVNEALRELLTSVKILSARIDRLENPPQTDDQEDNKGHHDE